MMDTITTLVSIITEFIIGNASTITAGATTMLAAVAIIGVYSHFRTLRNTERSLRFQMGRTIVDMLEEVRGERHLFYEKIPLHPSLADFKKLSDDEREKLDRLARKFDAIGQLAKYGFVPYYFVMDFYARPIVRSWDGLKCYIQDQREQRDQPGHMFKFEKLAELARKYLEGRQPGKKKRWRLWRC